MLGIVGKGINLLGHATLSTDIQALMGRNYLDYHCSMVDKFPTETCCFCREECEEFAHLTHECQELTREHPAPICDLELSIRPNLTSLVRFTRVGHIAKAMARRVDQDGLMGECTLNSSITC